MVPFGSLRRSVTAPGRQGRVALVSVLAAGAALTAIAPHTLPTTPPVVDVAPAHGDAAVVAGDERAAAETPAPRGGPWAWLSGLAGGAAGVAGTVWTLLRRVGAGAAHAAQPVLSAAGVAAQTAMSGAALAGRFGVWAAGILGAAAMGVISIVSVVASVTNAGPGAMLVVGALGGIVCTLAATWAARRIFRARRAA